MKRILVIFLLFSSLVQVASAQSVSSAPAIAYTPTEGVSTSNLTKSTDNISVTGNAATFNVTIINNGNTTATNFAVRLYASSNTTLTTADVPIFTQNVSSLAAGATFSFSTTVSLCTVSNLTTIG
jgi:hypothetical protein